MITSRESFSSKTFSRIIPAAAAFIGAGFAIYLATPAAEANPSAGARSAETGLKPTASDTDEAGTLPERIDVQTMKRRYWTVGNEDLMDVVQNRQYTKKGRLETALRYGFWSDDPFQSQKTMAFSLGYHFNEFFSLHGFYGKINASDSAAVKQVHQATAHMPGGVVNPVVNPGNSVMGAELRASLLYGKLSLLGKKIIYYDFNLAGGFSQHKTKDGSSSMGFFAGLGQQFFLTKTFFVTADYRVLWHTDKFNNPPVTERSLTTNWIQIGVGAFLF